MARFHGVPLQVMISSGLCSIVIAGPVWQGTGYTVVKRWRNGRHPAIPVGYPRISRSMTLMSGALA